MKKKILIYFISFIFFYNINTKDLIVSYSILTHNETKSLRNLLNFLSKHKDIKDEIIIVDDFSTNKQTINILKKISTKPNIKFYQHSLNHNFAQQRNYAKKLCKGDYIFTIDADEKPALYLIKNIRKILNSNADGYLVPRIHIVQDLPKDFSMHPNERGWIAWPDYQLRIFKNSQSIFWINPVHEMIINAKKIEKIPNEYNDNNLDLIEKYALTEKKTFDKWTNSHKFYLNCYKEWLINSLQNKNFYKASEILKINTHAHLSFLLDQDMRSIMPKNNYENIIKLINNLLIKQKISNEEIDSLINNLK